MNIATEDVVAHLERNLLLVVESILDDDDRAKTLCRFLLLLFFFLWLRQTDGKLLVALAANEDETLTWLVTRLVEDCIAVALGATNLLH